MDSQQVFLVPKVPPPLPTTASAGKAFHQNQQTTTQLLQQQQQPKCNICGTTQKLLRCAKCKAIYYCSTDHQHRDWPTHKQECRSLAKQRQINNRLQQLTNGCSALNINAHSNSPNTSSNETPICCYNYKLPGFDSLKKTNLKSNTFVLGTHENEILNSKAETVTQNSNRAEYMGSFDANSTTTDQMHNIMIQKSTEDAYVFDESNLSYYSSGQTQLATDELLNHSAEQTQQNKGIESGTTQSHSQQQKNNLSQQQNVLQYPVPQLSNHLINQHEKSSSYQIGAAFLDENLLENANERRYEELCRNIITDMNQYGLSVVDDFLGREKGLQILNEVHKMYSAGVFKDGQLVNNMKSEQDLRTIRGDKITWIKGVEPGCSNVGYLINQIDAVICRANSMRNNGKLGNYVIKERTKAMVACYPGSGSHYVMHVDNPNKDGRVITAIYYLNLNWDSRDSGGVLRIFPEQTKSVADIEPKFDRLIFFWSDKRNPHEVQPAHKTRYAITVWYFDANEREQALNRCKNSPNSNSSNSGSETYTNQSHTTTDTTSTSNSILTNSQSTSHTPAASTSSQQTLTALNTQTNDQAKSPATTTNGIQSIRRPIQVVRPNSYK